MSDRVLGGASTPAGLPEAPTEAEFVHDVGLDGTRTQGSSDLADVVYAAPKPFDLHVRIEATGSKEFRLKGHDSSLPAIERVLEGIARQGRSEALINLLPLLLNLVLPLTLIVGIAWAISPLLSFIPQSSKGVENHAR